MWHMENLNLTPWLERSGDSKRGFAVWLNHPETSIEIFRSN